MTKHKIISASFLGILLVIIGFLSLTFSKKFKRADLLNLNYNVDLTQVPDWTDDDFEFFMYGSMGAEIIPVRVLRAFSQNSKVDFDLLVQAGLMAWDPEAEFPLGVSQRIAPQLGNQLSVGLNCAACHVNRVNNSTGSEVRLVLGKPGKIAVDFLYKNIIINLREAREVKSMEKFLMAYLEVENPGLSHEKRDLFEKMLVEQEAALKEVIDEDPNGSKGVGAHDFHSILASELELVPKDIEEKRDLRPLVKSLLRLFHNVRVSLHIPDEGDQSFQFKSGSGRGDIFGLMAYSLSGTKGIEAPSKYGVVWNLKKRSWINWDASSDDLQGSCLMKAFALGAPFQNGKPLFDFNLLERQIGLSQRILSPHYPFEIDKNLIGAGEVQYKNNCASCHDGPQDDRRLHSLEEIGTDPNRARELDQNQVDVYWKALQEFKIDGYQPAHPPFRVTGKYWAPSLEGVWARSPYLHNGSVRTMYDLLTVPNQRPDFRKNNTLYDEEQMGFNESGNGYQKASNVGSSNSGHNYGTNLSESDKRALIEYLKTL
jgi:hypothetical protein